MGAVGGWGMQGLPLSIPHRQLGSSGKWATSRPVTYELYSFIDYRSNEGVWVSRSLSVGV